MSERKAKPILAVDCDDVVANINDAVREFVNETYGLNYTAADYQVTGEYHRYWERIWGTPDNERSDRFEAFMQSGRMAQLEPVSGAFEALRQLKKEYRLVMLTARTADQMAFTHAWLEQKAPHIFDDVTFMHLWDTEGEKATKAAICQQLGAEILVDDNYDHCRLAADVGVRALLFGDYGWNRAQELMPGMERVADWRAVRAALHGE